MAYRFVNPPLISAAPVEVPNPQRQASAIGFVTRVTALNKTAVSGGRSTVGVTPRSSPVKKAVSLGGRSALGFSAAGRAGSVQTVVISNARCALGLTSYRTSTKSAAARGHAVVGLTTSTRAEPVGAPLHAGPPVYPPAWVAGPPQ